MRFSDNPEFKALLAEKRQEIYQLTKDGVQETPQFKKIKSLLLEARRKKPESDFRYVLISKQDILSLCENASEKILDLFSSYEFLTNRIIYIDSQLKILNSSNDSFPEKNNDARRYFAKVATKDIVGFLIAPDATLHYFIDEKEYGDGVFYTAEARKGYEELKTIEHLEEVLNEYRVSLQQQDSYLKFFVTKAALRAFHQIVSPDTDEKTFLADNSQLLNNKPEELFREDLRNYIRKHMKIVVSREVMLENLDRLDIELTDEAGRDLYLIEIKWVGKSINAYGNGYGVEYGATPRINPNAVRQVVGYIDELLKDHQNIKIGYLAVFDARKDDMPDTCTGVTDELVSENIKQHFERFKKIPDFRVRNINPR